MNNIDPYLTERLVEARRSDLLRDIEASRIARRSAPTPRRWLAALRHVINARHAPNPAATVTVLPVVSALTGTQQGEVGEDPADLAS